MEDAVDPGELAATLAATMSADQAEIARAEQALRVFATSPNSFALTLLFLQQSPDHAALHKAAIISLKNFLALHWQALSQDTQTQVIDMLFSSIFTAESKSIARLLVACLGFALDTLERALHATPFVIQKVQQYWEEGNEQQVITSLRSLKACVRVLAMREFSDNADVRQQLQNIFNGCVDLVDRCSGAASFGVLKILMGLLRFIAISAKTTAALFSSPENVEQLHQALLKVIREDQSLVTPETELLFWKAKARAVDTWSFQVLDCFENAEGNEETMQQILMTVAPDYIETLLNLLLASAPTGDWSSLELRAYEQCMSTTMDTLVTQVCKREQLFAILRDQEGCIPTLLGQVLLDHLKLQPSDEGLLHESVTELAYRNSSELKLALSCPHGHDSVDECEDVCSLFQTQDLLADITSRSSAMRLVRELLKLSNAETVENYIQYLRSEFSACDPRSIASSSSSSSSPSSIAAVTSLLSRRMALTRAAAAAADVIRHTLPAAAVDIEDITRNVLHEDVLLDGSPIAVHLRALAALVIGRIASLMLALDRFDIWRDSVAVLTRAMTDPELPVREHAQIGFVDAVCHIELSAKLRDVVPSLLNDLADRIVALDLDATGQQLVVAFTACINAHSSRLGSPGPDMTNPDHAIGGVDTVLALRGEGVIDDEVGGYVC
ncbi:hypothetical protein PTSG_12904 [Salpingoeca rosetta]|uniref:Importin N-terminal domain-containing protein n=1 Tax=Salpingoeca rosetta (strain ATCC 50818 / BSB-021) TaxID=946362 RepID=F2ULJ6_SALR5|nr:uncharacterized protein PTSG_12904 [Salpingoeca rosetta]EGD77995.1 hypothetical protein PTSG_12904 [Salpingoeca rosetta]|eukprot:XP_004990057.1 hypothetical protein PTSG_12904 [Salpingoeca rosetta]